jgi:hypothetical protein
MNQKLLIRRRLKVLKKEAMGCPVIIELTLNDKTWKFDSGIGAYPHQWDKTKTRLWGKTEAELKSNNALDALENKIRRTYRRLCKELTKVKLDDIRGCINGRYVAAPFMCSYLSLYRDMIQRTKPLDQQLYLSYFLTEEIVLEYLWLRDRIIDHGLGLIDSYYVNEVYNLLRERGYRDSVIKENMTNLKRIFKYAIWRGFINKDPFNGWVLEQLK